MPLLEIRDLRRARPVVYAGRVLGTMNLLAGAGHYKESDAARLEPYAALLIGPFLDAIAADPDIGRT